MEGAVGESQPKSGESRLERYNQSNDPGKEDKLGHGGGLNLLGEIVRFFLRLMLRGEV